MSKISESDRKVKEETRLTKQSLEIFPFKSASKSEEISYNYLYDNNNYFINEDENMTIKITKEISWGNFESENYLNISLPEEEILELIKKETNSTKFAKDNQIKKNTFRYFKYIDSDEFFQINKVGESWKNEYQELNVNKVNFKHNLICQEPLSLSNEKSFLFSPERLVNGINDNFDIKVNKLIELRKTIKKMNLLSKKPDPNIFLQEIIFFTSFSAKVTNVTVKCKFCENSDHLSRNCPDFREYTDDICILCLGPRHKLTECPLRKCVKCNRIGHSAKSCNTDKNIEKCSKCKNVGHFSDDCLLYPSIINKELIAENICIFCNKKGHLVCPLKKDFLKISDYSEDIYVSSDDSDKTETASENINSKLEGEFFEKGEFSLCKSWKTYCPKCAGEHSKEECNNNSLVKNKNDQLRSQYSKMFFTMAPSKLARDKNFVGDDSFTSEDEKD